MPATLLDKIWRANTIIKRSDGATLLYVDRHFVHDAAFPGFDKLDAGGYTLRRPDLTFGMADHYVATGSSAAIRSPAFDEIVTTLSQNARKWGFVAYSQGSAHQGIVHVSGPELGLTLPGNVIVCGDSHTATHGALGSLSFGIGASEIAHVLATQTIWQRKPKAMRVTINGALGLGVSAKDLILALIGKIGTGGGTGHIIEYAGSGIHALSMEGRLTVCNMTIEAGARTGMIAPDEVSLCWLKGRCHVPKGADWDRAEKVWQGLHSDEGAVFEKEVEIAADEIAPMVTWGTSPEDVVAITDRVPDPARVSDPERRKQIQKSLDYMGLTPNVPMSEIKIDRAFIGSCTNGRLEDLRAAAAVAQGRKARVPTFVTPGSAKVKKDAEAEGLDKVFRDAGFEWTDPGCSMCVAMNGDLVPPGERCASSTNRNFEGRQGKGSRTHLLSPAMVAAAAVSGHLTDARVLGGINDTL
ncbi:3-isopropylmalate dehydratase large subunit [Roseobacter sp. HKCCD9010]|uniref:3-isopropylmalate dehydratase large subunit n=1 Tax=unclassified Roseobacter TaxID=196798 RepID=UPI0014919728|nr:MULTISPECIES: 3-isopropylmalate dehydratase large subunit [unclassified Roseobacter]MBF9052244.1 3-isopropylmalate dehydratase large subunit [Rhodobacterales bacterium HKCCD4356]NNV14083.1 3-isopropylmalate dehydratase large subunit [Roseobacter sp. HKCCD7357]NNV18404.1 3-isopropylmalate dehydratase large subunit [Roseobacter sp. HKCCD8768]NNV27843.1 3-isopropylmalate dehydratase large subunit [Roseobacter sp. HKCCD8192]NNV32165.1 3-isopropylmalate dehydratase large subunit [Roseobacter sp.